MPIGEPLANEQKLREGCAVAGVDAQRLLVGIRGSDQIAASFQQTRELEAQWSVRRLARQRRCERRLCGIQSSDGDLELSLVARERRLIGDESCRACCRIERFQHASLRGKRQRKVMPRARMRVVGANRAPRSGLRLAVVA